jgi:transcription elongation factor GreA
VAKVRLTQEGYKRLKEELEHEYARLEEATRILRELTGSSDDYDDSGLEESKREKARIEVRIDQLEDQLERAEIIADQHLDQAGLGSVITLRELSGQDSFDIQLVSAIEANVIDEEIPRISEESPLGRAVKGKRVGDRLKVTLNQKTTEYEVQAIS